ncbi:MAG: PAS domain-containing sensor histidine kinase [Oscillospiraceae bacterium]|nr:PAS domain-containing sensor histidine kinase [Oscillospiraceae bacterium]
MTRRIFRSIFCVALIMQLASMVLIMGVLNEHFTQVQFSQLRVETTLAAHGLTNEGPSYFDQLDNTMECRITWIAADGTVLYDNRSDSDQMVNHLQRQEVQQALQQGYGESRRYSDTLLEQYMYAAERLPDGTVLRLSTAQSSVLQLTLEMSLGISLVIAAAVFLSYMLAKRLSAGIVRPLNELDLNNALSNTEYEEILPLLRRLDIQQKQLQQQRQELHKKQTEFQTVTQSLKEGLVLISSGGSILSINPAAAKLLEVTPNCIGADFSVANRSAPIAQLAEQALSGQQCEQIVSLSSGKYLAAASPVRSGGKLSGVVLLLFDITQKHQAEQLRREFTANVSHELKTPLHTISGYAELMKTGLVPAEDMPGFAEKIYTQAQRMRLLVENTLRLSRLDEGAEDLQQTNVDLQQVARDVIQELTAPAELASVSITLESPPVSVRTVPQLVRAIVFNLAENAVKYNTPGGNVLIRISQKDTGILLSVTDTGIGIPEQDQERIFERFYRVDKSRSAAVDGTGLGLSIVKHACLILKARLELTSTPGNGTTISVHFPS